MEPRNVSRHASPFSAARGVTLIELMVGMLIGLIATLVITQVMSVAEAQKRNTTAGSDAQVNGALALFTLQRELQMAGYGLTTTRDVLGCQARGRYNGAALNWTLAPVVITAGATEDDPDQVTILTGAKTSPALPTLVVKEHKSDATEFIVQNTVGLAAGDLLIAVPPAIDAANWCSLLNVTAITTDAGGGHHVAHDVNSTTGAWNAAPASSIFPTAGYPVNSYLINAGQMVQRRYSLDTAKHMLREEVGNTAAGGALTAATDLYPEIVQFKAMYGKDTNKDGVVDVYDKTTPATQAEWAQVLVVRVAVVARSTQYEQRDVVTTSEPLWDVGGDANVKIDDARTCGPSRCITLKVSALGADWNHYRYRVYEAVVPLRNVLWSQ